METNQELLGTISKENWYKQPWKTIELYLTFLNYIPSVTFSVAKLWASSRAQLGSGCWFTLVLREECRLVLSAVKEAVLLGDRLERRLSQEECDLWWKTTGKGWNISIYYVESIFYVSLILFLITTLLPHKPLAYSNPILSL